MTKTLEENRAFVNAVFQVVNEAGMDRMNQGECKYFKEDGVTPICLIGQAMARVGLNLEDVRSVTTQCFTQTENNSVDAGVLLRAMGYDPIVVAAASQAQKIQDGRLNGWSEPDNWGNAVLAFVKVLHSHKKLNEFAPGFNFTVA